jgi:hypothetical protein
MSGASVVETAPELFLTLSQKCRLTWPGGPDLRTGDRSCERAATLLPGISRPRGTGWVLRNPFRASYGGKVAAPAW